MQIKTLAISHISKCDSCIKDSAIQRSLAQCWGETDPLITSTIVIDLLAQIEKVHSNKYAVN